MRYFKQDILMRINSCDEEIRSKAEKEWIRNDAAYNQEFSSIKDLLPKPFLESFIQCQGFHDYLIDAIYLQNSGRNYCCIIELHQDEESYSIHIENIIKSSINITSLKNLMDGQLSWGYCEFSVGENNSIIMEGFFDCENSFLFEFENISCVAHSTEDGLGEP